MFGVFRCLKAVLVGFKSIRKTVTALTQEIFAVTLRLRALNCNNYGYDLILDRNDHVTGSGFSWWTSIEGQSWCVTSVKAVLDIVSCGRVE